MEMSHFLYGSNDQLFYVATKFIRPELQEAKILVLSESIWYMYTLVQ